MSTPNDAAAMAAFTARMKAIAKKNNDEFKTTCTYEDGIYKVEVVEKAEGHGFTDGTGGTVAAACEDALKHVPHALEQWGYKDNQ